MRLVLTALLTGGLLLAQDQGPPCRVIDCKVDKHKDGFNAKVTVDVGLPAETKLELYYSRES